VASDDAPRASIAGLLGPNADAKSLVLDLINRQDRYMAPRTCHARRRELGARTTTLVLSEDKAGEALLPSADLASSFPSVRTLVLRCKAAARETWPQRFAALQQLRHLDLGSSSFTATPLTSTDLAALAQLPSLQSLHATVDRELRPPCWAALGSLKQLTGLRPMGRRPTRAPAAHRGRGAPAAGALAPQHFFFSPEQLACLTALRSLGSLSLCMTADAAPALRSLTALQGLTHLALENDEMLGDLLAAVRQLTGLASLELWGIKDGVPLQPLAALQRLTSLTLKVLHHRRAAGACTGRPGPAAPAGGQPVWQLSSRCSGRAGQAGGVRGG
jgi:hypothetical protein